MNIRTAVLAPVGMTLLSLLLLGGCSSATAPASDAEGATTSAESSLSRADAIARAEQWASAELHYCQAPNHARDYDPSCATYCNRANNAAWDPYRSDCSGLVSWAWGLAAPGRTTYGFAPFVTDITQVIAASELQPGDAVNNSEHVMLFKAWAGSGVATFIEEPGCSSATPFAHEVTTGVSISGSSIHVAANGMTFTAIRYTGLSNVSNAPAVIPTPYYSGLAHDASGKGYWMVGTDGGVFSFGDAPFYGSLGGTKLAAPIVGITSTPSGHGYLLVGSDGGAFTFGDAEFHGSMGAAHLNAPVVGIATTPSGHGYWLVASDGGLFSFGDAEFHGAMGGTHLNAPVVGMAATPSGHGYWLVASDGGLFAFGDAEFHGSMGGTHLNAPVVGMTAAATGRGYWLAAADGGLFSFGDAGFFGSMGGKPLNGPVVGISAAPDGGGYWLLGGDGGLFSFGDAGFFGSRR